MAIQLKKEEVKQLKIRLLSILGEVDRLCRDNNIKYSLAYGTLLGAVRHNGFIPWDDDIDIMMERKEYDKFKSIVGEKLNKDYYYVDLYENKHYGLMNGKVMLRNTVMKESSIATSKSPSGIYIDVFVFDVVPNSDKLRKKQFKKAKRIKRLTICRAKYYFGQKGLKLIIYRLRRLVYLIIPRKLILNAYRRNAVRYENCKDYKFLGNLGGVYSIEKDSYPKDVFSKYKNVKFENLTCMSIDDDDRVLAITYGDYMKLPPEEKRIPHHFVEEIRF